MTNGERVNQIRKSLAMTLDKFGEKLGVTKVAISNIEKGNRNLTDQMAKAICREYNVNYLWLTTGEGEMFLDNEDDVIEIIDRIMTGENEFHKNLFKTFARLDEDELLALESILDKFIAEKSNTSNPKYISSGIPDTTEQLEEEYKKSRLSSAQKKDSSVSNTTSDEFPSSSSRIAK